MHAGVLPAPRGDGMCMQKSAEGIVGVEVGDEPGNPAEGLNINNASRTSDLDANR
jgi:hypothetical protein